MKKTTTIIITILVLALIIITAFWLNKRTMVVAPTDDSSSAIVINDSTITEENFSGSRPIITGSSVLALVATEYLDQEIASFKVSADTEVPDLRKEFGEDAPPAHYSLDFKANHIVGVATESIVIDGYRYTGGANGMSFYKVFTVRKDSGELLNLRDIVNTDQQEAFTTYVKSELLIRQEAVFVDSVNALTFDSFKNFALDENALIVYFDKYDIGPGALGPVAFSLALPTVDGYLSL